MQTQICQNYKNGECQTYYCPYVHGLAEKRIPGPFNLPFTKQNEIPDIPGVILSKPKCIKYEQEEYSENDTKRAVSPVCSMTRMQTMQYYGSHAHHTADDRYSDERYSAVYPSLHLAASTTSFTQKQIVKTKTSCSNNSENLKRTDYLDIEGETASTYPEAYLSHLPTTSVDHVPPSVSAIWRLDDRYAQPLAGLGEHSDATHDPHFKKSQSYRLWLDEASHLPDDAHKYSTKIDKRCKTSDVVETTGSNHSLMCVEQRPEFALRGHQSDPALSTIDLAQDLVKQLGEKLEAFSQQTSTADSVSAPFIELSVLVMRCLILYLEERQSHTLPSQTASKVSAIEAVFDKFSAALMKLRSSADVPVKTDSTDATSCASLCE